MSNIENETEIISFEPEEIMDYFNMITTGYHLEELSQQDIKTLLADMVYFDSNGDIWTIGVNSGKWYYHDGNRWRQGTPVGMLFQVFIDPSENTPQKTPAKLDLKNPILKELMKQL